jgi:hypothetical protein
MVLYKGLSTVAQESSSSIEKAKRRTAITSLANSSNSSVLAASGKMSGALPPLHVSTGAVPTTSRVYYRGYPMACMCVCVY